VIDRHVAERAVYVPTAKAIADLQAVDLHDVDVITFSGSGEPTLAANLGECLQWLAEHVKIPVFVLTNGSMLVLPEVRKELAMANRVSVKLDAATEATFVRINRPIPGVTLERVLQGARALRAEHPGHVSLQVMVMTTNDNELPEIAKIAKEISPHSIELNLPKRPVPNDWSLDARGNRANADAPAAHMAILSKERTCEIVHLFESTCHVPVYCSSR
jgi:wyosine [tRNA(Phe)-imidazoG37] synthetase (radical SAM superfamily)